MTPDRDTLARSALLSTCGAYRYSLTRAWEPALGSVVFCMLNPSTADAEIDDPTIRRCMGFARSWGYGAMEVVNLYAYRATDPRELGCGADIVGPDNDACIRRAFGRTALAVCAWGATPAPEKAERVRIVRQLAHSVGRRLYALGTTKHGDPRHPLYLRRDARPECWEAHDAD